MFRREGQGIHRNKKSKLGQKSNNKSNNILSQSSEDNIQRQIMIHSNGFEEIQQHPNSSNNISINPTTKSNNFLSSRVKSPAQKSPRTNRSPIIAFTQSDLNNSSNKIFLLSEFIIISVLINSIN